jgi:hypothetical protein
MKMKTRRVAVYATRRAVGIFLGAILAMLGTVIVGQTAAMARPSNPVPVDSVTCTPSMVQGEICFWDAQFFRGLWFSPVFPDPGPMCQAVPGFLRNSITSIANPSHNQYDVFQSTNCSGSRLAVIFPRTANDNIGPATNDRINSVRRTR